MTVPHLGYESEIVSHNSNISETKQEKKNELNLDLKIFASCNLFFFACYESLWSTEDLFHSVVRFKQRVYCTKVIIPLTNFTTITRYFKQAYHLTIRPNIDKFRYQSSTN